MNFTVKAKNYPEGVEMWSILIYSAPLGVSYFHMAEHVPITQDIEVVMDEVEVANIACTSLQYEPYQVINGEYELRPKNNATYIWDVNNNKFGREVNWLPIGIAVALALAFIRRR